MNAAAGYSGGRREKKKSIAAVRKAAMGEGMRTLMQSGILKVINGDTDFIEVLSVCMR